LTDIYLLLESIYLNYYANLCELVRTFDELFDFLFPMFLPYFLEDDHYSIIFVDL